MSEANLKQEKKILNMSFIGSVLFLAAEIVFAIITGSKAVLMDCVYDLADLAMIGPFMLLVPLLYKKETEKRPYGFSQIESLFVLIKYVILLTIDVVLVINCVKTILAGGNEVDASLLAVFELAISFGCVIMWIVLRRMSVKYKSPSIKAELFIWKIDALCTLGVGAAFAINLVLIRTPAAWICPYIDPGIAIILAVSLIKEPVSMIIESLRSLVLFAPEKEMFSQIEEICKSRLDVYDCKVTFTDVIKTGRKLWIQVFFTHKKEQLDIGRLKTARIDVTEALKKEFDDIDLVLIPDLADGFHQVEAIEPAVRRKDKIAYIESQEQKKTAKVEKKATKATKEKKE